MIQPDFRQNFIQSSILKGGDPADSQQKTHFDNFLSLFQASRKTMENAPQPVIVQAFYNGYGLIYGLPAMENDRQALLLGPVNLDLQRLLLMFEKRFVP